MTATPLRLPMAARCGRLLCGLGCLLTLQLMVWLPSTVRAAEPERALEHGVKAAFLYKFGSYVNWPAETFPAPDSPLVIGVTSGAVADELDRVVRGRRVADRPLVLRRVAAGDPIDGMHLLFIGREAGAAGRRLLQASRDFALLTVTETDADADAAERGAINFVVVDDRVRFDVDLVLAQRHGLRLSARLLSVARSVREAPP